MIDGNPGASLNDKLTNGVTGATFSTNMLPVGMHNVQAFYSGDGSFMASTGNLPGGQVVKPGGGPATAIIREVAYTYYDGREPYGNAGDLKTAETEDGQGIVLDTKYYRNYTPADIRDNAGNLIGYVHG